MFGCCFPPVGSRAQRGDSVQREALLRQSNAASGKEEEAVPQLEVRRIFSRLSMSEIPENSEVAGEAAEAERQSTEQRQASAPQSDALPPRPPARELERLFSRGAARQSPLGLSRLFSRGAIVRQGSNLSLGRRSSNFSLQSNNQASTADESIAEEYDETRADSLTEMSTPRFLDRKRGSSMIQFSLPRSSKLRESTLADVPDEGVSNDEVRYESLFLPTLFPTTFPRKKYPELAEALSKLKDVADTLVEGSLVATTSDNSDHTYSGIFFDIHARTLVPIAFIEVQAISIRGKLGPISIRSVDGTFEGKQMDASEWTLNFGPEIIEPSEKVLREIVLNIPIRMSPGTSKGIYIHSELPGDEAIVYDDHHLGEFTYEDNYLRTYPGVAHVSNVPFSARAPWGGVAFRKPRSFVGSLRYGVKLMLWNPEIHQHFPPSFRRAVFTLLLCQKRLANEPNSFGQMPTAVLFTIINMLPYDWFPLEFTSADSDVRFVPEEARPFQYGGHVGRIAELKHLFDSAKKETTLADPNSLPSVSRILTEDSDDVKMPDASLKDDAAN